MKALVLAAGYGTRLGILGERTPKALLPVADRPLLDHLLERLDPLVELEEAAVVSNTKFFPAFLSWLEARAPGRLPVRVLDDGTSTNETRLGAIGDVRFALEELALEGGSRGSALLVVAGDHIFDIDFSALVADFRARDATTIGVEREKNVEELRRCGVVELDATNRVIGFIEKPAEPRTDILSPPIYLYHRRDLPKVQEYLEGGGNPDAPGHFLEWLHRRTAVYAHFLRGRRHDVGHPAAYQAADALFRERRSKGQ